MSKSDVSTRVGVGIVLIALAATALWVGGFLFWMMLSVAGLLMLHEWGGLSNATPGETRLAQYALSIPLAIMCPFAAGPGYFALGLIFAAFFFTGIITRKGQLAAGALYVGLPVLALLLLRLHPQGFALTLWAMALVWASDSGAYFAGRAIGGPKLAPAISPNKTWAGAIAGVVSAILFTIVLVVITEPPSAVAMIAISPFLAALSQLGDLYESHLKRLAGVKDSGHLLPGHGGLLDRLDGLVPVAPVAVLVLALHYAWTTGGLWW